MSDGPVSKGRRCNVTLLRRVRAVGCSWCAGCAGARRRAVCGGRRSVAVAGVPARGASATGHRPPGQGAGEDAPFCEGAAPRGRASTSTPGQGRPCLARPVRTVAAVPGGPGRWPLPPAGGPVTRRRWRARCRQCERASTARRAPPRRRPAPACCAVPVVPVARPANPPTRGHADPLARVAGRRPAPGAQRPAAKKKRKKKKQVTAVRLHVPHQCRHMRARAALDR